MQEAGNELQLLRSAVIDEVRAKRASQDATWGEQKNSPVYWAVMTAEVLGEVAEQALLMQASCGAHVTVRNVSSANYREALIKLAAVACAVWECSVYGSAPAPDEADRDRCLELVARTIGRHSEKSMILAEKLDPLTHVCGLQYLLGDLAKSALDSIGTGDKFDYAYHDHAMTLASAATNAVVFLDLGKWTWDGAKEALT